MAGKSLQTQLGTRIALVALGSLGVMVLLLSILMHQSMHRQTDALLLHLAHAEANNITEEAADFHVHDMEIYLPGMSAGLRERYALVFDTEGRVLDHTGNLTIGATVPGSMLMDREADRASFLNSDELTPKLLRLVVVPMELKGRKAYVSVGVAHEDLDASLWTFVLIAVPVALIVALMITAAGVWLIRRRLADLSRLSEACRHLELERGREAAGESLGETLTMPEHAAEEFRLLAHTLRELLDRVHGLLETQNRFVAEAAHELRTPLTSLRGDLELALRRERDGATYREFIGEALEDVARLQRLALDLLEGARGSEGQLALQEENLTELLETALAHHQKALEEASLKVRCRIPEEQRVQVERRGMQRVLGNLIENTLRHADARQLDIWSEANKEGIHLYLADDGVGIDESMRESLFHPFQRGSQQGFGLGLYIAHQLMKAQGGNLTLIPQTKGTQWHLTLPRKPDSPLDA